MSNPVLDPLDEALATDWRDFLIVLAAALAEYRTRFARSYRRTLDSWHTGIFNELRSNETRAEFIAAWRDTFQTGRMPGDAERWPAAERVLRQELRGVTDMLLDLVNVTPVIVFPRTDK